MCVGVFGPSQAGKSYLVSILASRDGRPLQARFADRTYDFLREINPPGNRESTGLVTRFGLGLSDGPADFPVKVRLLTQTDIVKILGNSFLLDFDHQKAEFVRPDGAAIRKRLSELRAKAQPAPVVTGLRRAGMVEVVSGLAVGDEVVTAGQIKLRPGAAVMALPRQSAPEPGSGAPPASAPRR